MNINTSRKSNKKITVFTPTYNRGYILSRCYESLKRQTCDDFEWLIVDDGSDDNTFELVAGWIGECIVEIRYFSQINGGKQRAHNYGVDLCGTELFICVDSDDYLTDNAIEVLLSHWEKIKNQNNICGIASVKGFAQNNPIGGYFFPENIKKSTLLDLYRKYKFKGEAALLYRSDILKQFKFDVASGEKFIGETYIYSQIDQKYELSLLPEILNICEYLPDGYTKNKRKLLKNNPVGYMILNKQAVGYSVTFTEKYINMIKYIVGCKLCGENCFVNPLSKILTVLAYMPAMFFYRKLYRNL